MKSRLIRKINCSFLAVLILFFVVFACIVTNSVFAETKEENWQILTTEHFKIHYTKTPDKYLQRVIKILEEEFDRVVRIFGKPPVSKIKVFICSSKKEFNKLTGVNKFGWDSAVTDPSKRIIVLGSYMGSYSRIREKLIHEFAHVIVGGAAGDQYIPRWFYEGTAMWVSIKWGRIEESHMRRAVLGGKLLYFDQIETVFKLATIDIPIAYIMSFFTVNYLAEHYKQSVFTRLLGKMSLGKDFPTAFYEATGITVKQFEREIHTSARKQF